MAFEYWDVVFIAGFLGLFIGVLLGAVAFGIKWFLKILVNEGGYNYYKLITKSGALRCVGNKKVFPFPRNYHGEPSDVFKTFEVDWMTELIGKKGKAVELEKDNFEVFEGLEKKHSIVIDGTRNLRGHNINQTNRLRFDLAKMKVESNKMAMELLRIKATFNIELTKGIDKVISQVAKVNPYISMKKPKSLGSGGGFGG